jgi:2-amino-4-hydroxy-6-hydroxymethyldihydropteridine diphosphokinase
MTDIGFGLGSNIGDPPANIRAALHHLRASPEIEITKVSSIYRTAPWGYKDQAPFANACALARTPLDPESLLKRVKAIEEEMGRTATVRWGPRLIDIDILFYGGETRMSRDLILPHKELFHRAFVLVPLAEIAPDLVLGGRSVAQAAAAINRDDIAKWNDPHGQAD